MPAHRSSFRLLAMASPPLDARRKLLDSILAESLEGQTVGIRPSSHVSSDTHRSLEHFPCPRCPRPRALSTRCAAASPSREDTGAEGGGGQGRPRRLCRQALVGDSLLARSLMPSPCQQVVTCYHISSASAGRFVQPPPSEHVAGHRCVRSHAQGRVPHTMAGGPRLGCALA